MGRASGAWNEMRWVMGRTDGILGPRRGSLRRGTVGLAVLLIACGGGRPPSAGGADEDASPSAAVAAAAEPGDVRAEVAPETDGAVAEAAAVPSQRPAPAGFTDLATLPGVRIEARYATSNNFTGEPLPGYAAPGAWLLDHAAAALGRVQRSLEADGLGLLVYDAYRPLRATKAMVAWAHRTDQVHLLDNGYIARRSNHNRGNTIDLTLVHLDSGEPLDMGTPWDTLDERAHTRNAEGEAATHRQRLVAAMRAEGFKNYWKEWWHFSHVEGGDAPHRDVPYGADEPD